MEGALIIIGFIQFVVLCLFFQLVGDVRALRVKLDSKNKFVWLDRYHKSMFLGRKEESLYNLQEYIWVMINRDRGSYSKLKDQWSDAFLKLDSEFPDYPF